MLGAQGTGKGTIAGMISEQTGYPQIYFKRGLSTRRNNSTNGSK